MDDPNSVKARINRTNTYNGLMELRKDVRALYGKYPFSIFVDLRGRVEEKINTFNSPMCDQATITVLMKDGDSVQLERSVCHYAVTNNIRLSDHIFSEFPNARDFRIETGSVLGSYGNASPDSTEKDKAESSRISDAANPQIDVLQNRVEYLIRLMDHMSRTYGDAIPKIVSDVKDITERLDDLYKKILKDGVES